VLLDDDLETLVSGIAMGRRIFDNLRKASIYIAAIHIPVAGLALLPLVLGLPPLLLPMHVVLIEMIIDPICAIAFENEPAEPDILRHPPRAPDEPLIGWRQFGVAAVLGAVLLAASLGAYALMLADGADAAIARTIAFVVLTAGNLMLVRVVATRAPTLRRVIAFDHAAFWLVAAVATVVTAACILVPVLQALFQFGRPTLLQVSLAIGAGAASALVFDVVKPLPWVQRVLGRSLPVQAAAP
jgi:Ca2+-transporting ATPase